MNDIMLDLESLSTKSYSVIVQVGAVYFDRYTGELGKELCVNINIQDCLNHGLKVDGGALKFWFEHENRSWLKDPVNLSKALQMIRDFYNKKALVWSHATFDFPLLADAYEVLGQGFPFHYRNLRDIRTLVDLSKRPYKKDKEGDPKTHDGLDDCKYQVKYCVECFNLLRKDNKYFMYGQKQ